MTQDHRIQPVFSTYQGKGLPGYDARPSQPSIVISDYTAGEALRPGYAVKFVQSDQQWYLTDDSEGTIHDIADVTSSSDINTLIGNAALGDYFSLPSGYATADPANGIFYNTNGSSALNAANSLAAATSPTAAFRLVVQSATANRLVLVDTGSSVGAAGQRAIPHGSDRANAEGIVYFHPNVVPKTASAFPTGANSRDYIEYDEDKKVHVMRILGCCYGVAGESLRGLQEVEYAHHTQRWVAAPSTSRSNRRAVFTCEERSVVAGELVAIRILGHLA